MDNLLNSVAAQGAGCKVSVERDAVFRVINGRQELTDPLWCLSFVETLCISTLGQDIHTIGFAYDAASGPAVAGFDLQGAGHSLPHVGLTLPDVQHRDVHEGHLNCTIRPQLDVIHGTLVRLDVAAAKQLRRPVIEVGAVGEVLAAQLAGLSDVSQAVDELCLHWVVLTELVKVLPCLAAPVRADLQTHVPAE